MFHTNTEFANQCSHGKYKKDKENIRLESTLSFRFHDNAFFFCFCKFFCFLFWKITYTISIFAIPIFPSPISTRKEMFPGIKSTFHTRFRLITHKMATCFRVFIIFLQRVKKSAFFSVQCYLKTCNFPWKIWTHVREFKHMAFSTKKGPNFGYIKWALAGWCFEIKLIPLAKVQTTPRPRRKWFAFWKNLFLYQVETPPRKSPFYISKIWPLFRGKRHIYLSYSTFTSY